MSSTTPASLFRMVDENLGDEVMTILETQPESLESCLLICYLIRVGIEQALDEDDSDEIEAIWTWAETALEHHSQIRQLWCCDEVGRYLASQPQPPGWEETWNRARAQAASEVTI